jgi:hypothetical protein
MEPTSGSGHGKRTEEGLQYTGRFATQQGLSHIDNADRNRRVLLNTIREKGPVSRVELSSACRLSIATTKRLVD